MALGNLAKRTLSALVLAPLVLAAIIYGGVAFTGLIILVGLIMCQEWLTITKTGHWAWKPCGLMYGILTCFSFYQLRQFSEAHDALGLALVLWLLLVVWATDIGAYAAGRTIGGPKLAPRISPNKTWAGLVGGMVAAGATAYFAYIFQPLQAHFGFSPLLMLPVGAVFAVFAQGGDLFESWLKRRFGVKDSGNIIPGHGGILDRVDGFTTTAPLLALLLWWHIRF